jgi:VanZ family protein
MRGLVIKNSGIIFGSYYLLVIALAVVLAFTTEMLQYLLPIGRSGNLYDAIADVAGSALGGLFFIFYKKKFKK